MAKTAPADILTSIEDEKSPDIQQEEVSSSEDVTPSTEQTVVPSSEDSTPSSSQESQENNSKSR